MSILEMYKILRDHPIHKYNPELIIKLIPFRDNCMGGQVPSDSKCVIYIQINKFIGRMIFTNEHLKMLGHEEVFIWGYKNLLDNTFESYEKEVNDG